jgi:hypothetical protein
VIEFFHASWGPTNSNNSSSSHESVFSIEQEMERQELDSYHADVVNVIHDQIAFQELKADIRASKMCTGAGAQQVIQHYVGDRAKQIEQRYRQKPRRRRAIDSQEMKNLATCVKDNAESDDEMTESTPEVKPSFFSGVLQSVSWNHLKEGSLVLDGVMQSFQTYTKRPSAPSAA